VKILAVKSCTWFTGVRSSMECLGRS